MYSVTGLLIFFSCQSLKNGSFSAVLWKSFPPLVFFHAESYLDIRMSSSVPFLPLDCSFSYPLHKSSFSSFSPFRDGEAFLFHLETGFPGPVILWPVDPVFLCFPAKESWLSNGILLEWTAPLHQLRWLLFNCNPDLRSAHGQEMGAVLLF